MTTKQTATGLSDEQVEGIKSIAKGYRNAVRRGDCTAAWAADTAAAEYTYPYATTAHWSAVRAAALRAVK